MHLSNKTAQPNSILIENGIITDISANYAVSEIDKSFDLSGSILCAGFVDIHNHGAVGVDVNTATAEDLQKVSRFLATKGVAAWLPTLVPDSEENYQKTIDAINEVMRRQESEESEAAAQILGVHYEGVFANEKMCGALRPQFFKKFINGDELTKLPKLETGVHLTTYAPEVEGGIELTKELVKQNWIPSIGHTRADRETLTQAFEAGAKSITHLFNAMTGVHHRDLGVAGWALSNDEIFCEIIADGIHVAPPILRLAQRAKAAGKLMLVSDSVALTGLGDGDFELWGEKIKVVGGKTENERGSIAGSVITMLDAVQTMLSLGVSAAEVSQMASANPAQLLGVEKTHGSIEIGKRADFVALDAAGNLKLSIIGGKVAFQD